MEQAVPPLSCFFPADENVRTEEFKPWLNKVPEHKLEFRWQLGHVLMPSWLDFAFQESLWFIYHIKPLYSEPAPWPHPEVHMEAFLSS